MTGAQPCHATKARSQLTPSPEQLKFLQATSGETSSERICVKSAKAKPLSLPCNSRSPECQASHQRHLTQAVRCCKARASCKCTHQGVVSDHVRLNLLRQHPFREQRSHTNRHAASVKVIWKRQMIRPASRRSGGPFAILHRTF